MPERKVAAVGCGAQGIGGVQSLVVIAALAMDFAQHGQAKNAARQMVQVVGIGQTSLGKFQDLVFTALPGKRPAKTDFRRSGTKIGRAQCREGVCEEGRLYGGDGLWKTKI